MRIIDAERIEGALAVPLPPECRAFSIGSPSDAPAEVRGCDLYDDEVCLDSGSPGVLLGSRIEEDFGRPAGSVAEYRTAVADRA